MPRKRKGEIDQSQQPVHIRVSQEMLVQALLFVSQCIPGLPKEKLKTIAREVEKLNRLIEHYINTY